MDARMKLIETLLMPIEAWVDVWRWLGEVGGDDRDLINHICHIALRTIWALVTLVLIPWLFISLMIGA